MVYTQKVKKGEKTYIYLAKTARVSDKIVKTMKYLGKESELTRQKIEDRKRNFALEADKDMLNTIMKDINKRCNIRYPLNIDDIRKIEMMNLRYKEMKKDIKKEDWTDIRKRFIANFVFESNALEGNSLTLKNFSEIIFENKIIESGDLRDIYDARNSYKVFSGLFTARKGISENFIINLHKRIMQDIDDRTGYKKLPNILLGKRTELTPPENVEKEMKALIRWYNNSQNRLYPHELAFRFHHKFEQIHPFADGNGRVGRMLLNYILIRKGYFPIIIRKTQRNSYLKALEAADSKQFIPLMRFAISKTKETYRKFFEVYYKYI